MEKMVVGEVSVIYAAKGAHALPCVRSQNIPCAPERGRGEDRGRGSWVGQGPHTGVGVTVGKCTCFIWEVEGFFFLT